MTSGYTIVGDLSGFSRRLAVLLAVIIIGAIKEESCRAIETYTRCSLHLSRSSEGLTADANSALDTSPEAPHAMHHHLLEDSIARAPSPPIVYMTHLVTSSKSRLHG